MTKVSELRLQMAQIDGTKIDKATADWLEHMEVGADEDALHDIADDLIPDLLRDDDRKAGQLEADIADAIDSRLKAIIKKLRSGGVPP